MSKSIKAVFIRRDEGLEAVEDLRRKGFSDDSITLMSSEPLVVGEAHEHEGPRSLIGLFAIAGGLLGILAAILLTVLTSREVGLNTGGMPIVAPWAFGIIVFEMGALGAILGTLGRMAFEAGLLKRGSLNEYDLSVSEGKIVVAVNCPNDSRLEVAKRVFTRKGAKTL